MERVLIMTRNILSDKELQEKLQYLNYEVFCSSHILDHLLAQYSYPELLNHFRFIVFSETISNAEIEQLLPCLENKGKQLYRKVNDLAEAEEWSKNLATPVLNVTLDSLREQLMSSQFHYEKEDAYLYREISNFEKFRVPEQIDQLNFSRLEKKVFIELYRSKGEVVTREELCKRVWRTNVTNSHLSHISAIIKKMRNKLKKMNLPEDAVRTVWGEGYVLSPEYFYTDERFTPKVRQLA